MLNRCSLCDAMPVLCAGLVVSWRLCLSLGTCWQISDSQATPPLVGGAPTPDTPCLCPADCSKLALCPARGGSTQPWVAHLGEAGGRRGAVGQAVEGLVQGGAVKGAQAGHAGPKVLQGQAQLGLALEQALRLLVHLRQVPLQRVHVVPDLRPPPQASLMHLASAPCWGLVRP